MPIAKVATYGMGKVAMYPSSELRQLQQMKQNERKLFERNPGNEQRLGHLKKLKHNYERSQAMLKSLQKVGLNDSDSDINNIISHLLNVGEAVTIDNWRNYPSDLEAPNGTLRIRSTWTFLPDGRKYLSTLNFIPSSKGG